MNTLKALVLTLALVAAALSVPSAQVNTPSVRMTHSAADGLFTTPTLVWSTATNDSAILRMPREDDGAYRLVCEAVSDRCLPLKAVADLIREHGTERQK